MDTQKLMGDESTPAITPTSDERTMALLSHVLALFAGILAPLIIYLLKKDDSSFVREHAKESLNFQLTVMIIVVVLCITIIGILLVWVVGIINVVLVIIATIKTNENKYYRYPFNFRLIK